MVFISVYDKMKTKIFILVFFALVLALFSSVNFINAAADFQVTGFSCSPSEVGVNALFSCTATIKNNGESFLFGINLRAESPNSNVQLEFTDPFIQFLAPGQEQSRELRITTNPRQIQQ